MAWQDSDMSFSLFCEETGWEYNGGSLSGLFVRKRNLVRPAFWRMLADIVRFNRTATRVLARGDEPTVGQFLREEGYSREFAEKYLLPMGAAIWSCPTGTFAEFPMRFIAEFYSNHGLLSVFHRPTWRVIAGGSRSYVERLVSRLRGAGTRTEIVQIDHRILSRVITDCKSKSVKSIILGILAANRSFARVYKPAY